MTSQKLAQAWHRNESLASTSSGGGTHLFSGDEVLEGWIAVDAVLSAEALVDSAVHVADQHRGRRRIVGSKLLPGRRHGLAMSAPECMHPVKSRHACMVPVERTFGTTTKNCLSWIETSKGRDGCMATVEM